MSIRFVLGFPLAMAITVSLFLLMQQLIQTEFEPPAEVEPFDEIKILREPVDEGPEIEEPGPPDRPETETPPPPPPITIPTSNVEGPPIEIPPPVFDPPKSADASPTGNAVPIIRIRPDYPEKAAIEGIEGWVLVGFDITPAGTVQNAVVVDAEPARVFDRSALRAIQRLKYRAKIMGGKPVFQYGVRQMITYELEQDE